MQISQNLKKALSSGNFTVYFHDNGCAVIYEGNFTESQLDKYHEEEKELVELFNSEPDGYYTSLEELLVSVLGGSLYSV